MKIIRIGNIEYVPHVQTKGVSDHEICCHVKEGSKYQIATLKFNQKHDDEYDVVSCGDRAFGLSDEDYKDFRMVLKLIKDSVYNDCLNEKKH